MLCTGLAATSGASQDTRQLATVHPSGPASHRGIGIVRLNETLANVTRALGAGHKITSGVDGGFAYAAYNYRSGPVRLEVDYGAAEGALPGATADHVTGVVTSSPSAILYGHRLSEGLAALKPIFRAHHWHIDSCRGRVFTALSPGGPGTGIEWNKGRLERVQIDVGGVLDLCANY